MKTLTHEQAEAKRRKAVQLLRDVVGDEERADRFEDMDADDYAEHKGFAIENPHHQRRPPAMSMTKAQLEDRVRELEDDKEALQEQLDAVADIVAPEIDDEDEDDDLDDEEDDDEDEDDEDFAQAA